MNLLRTARLCFAVALAAIVGAGAALAQEPVPADTSRASEVDTTLIPGDIASPTAGDLLVPRIDGSPTPEAPARRGDRLEHPVRFSASDSLVIVFGDDSSQDGDIGTLYGNASAQYNDATLTALEIDLLFQREILRARGPEDVDVREGRPSFNMGGEGFTGRELAFHLPSQRGRVVGARTTAASGYVQGGTVVQSGTRITYAQDVIYTTCEYEEHNHWGIHSHRMKIVDGEWVYSGAARLHILGIPTPLWLPFGFFPATEGRRSGPLPVDYGEQSDLGFYLRNLGFYWALSDFMDLQLTGGLYTSGSYEAGTLFRYARRHAYNGSLQLGYRFERRGEPQDPGHARQTQASLRWTHNQTLNAAETARLAGSVDLRTAGYARTLGADYDQRVTQQTSSNLNFTQRWRSGRNLGVSYRQSLNLSDGSTNITLPTVNFTQPRIFPFRASDSRGQRWFEQISLQYTFQGTNTYNFRPLSDTTGVTWLEGLVDYDAFRSATGQTERFDLRAQHSIPLTASYNIGRVPLLGMQLDMSPNLTYREEWFASRREARTGEDGRAVYDERGRLVFDTVTGFTPVRQATFNMSASTRVFGTFPYRIGNLDGFRHEMRPTVSFSYAPDYSGAFWGQVATVPDSLGQPQTYSVRQGIAVPGRPQQSLNLSLSNVFQTRVVGEDSEGATRRRALTLLNLDLASGYDLAADSLNWRDISLRARSTIADQVNISFNAQYSPYAVDSIGALVNRFHFQETGRLLRFMRAGLNASTQLRGGRAGGAELAPGAIRPPHIHDLDGLGADGLLPYDFRRPDLGFVDFAIPWSLGLDFSYGVTRNFATGDTRTFATLNNQFDLAVTSNWRVSGRSGFDFEQMEFVPTQISVLRDLHCWEMSLSWLPFGQVRAFSFSIYLKGGHLSSLLRLDVPNVDRTRHF